MALGSEFVHSLFDEFARLLKWAETRNRSLLAQHVQPIQDGMRRVVEDYRSMLERAADRLSDPHVDAGDVLSWLKSERMRLLLDRDEVGAASRVVREWNAATPEIRAYGMECLLLIGKWHGVVTGRGADQEQLLAGSAITELFCELEDLTIQNEDRELLVAAVINQLKELAALSGIRLWFSSAGGRARKLVCP